MKKLLIHVICAIVALMVIFSAGYTVAGHFSGIGAGVAAVWAAIVMLIYGLPVLLCSAVIALAARSRRLRVSVATLATAAIVGASCLFAKSEAVASIAILIGAGTALLLAMVPERAAQQGSAPLR